jgi:hypothetical protein
LVKQGEGQFVGWAPVMGRYPVLGKYCGILGKIVNSKLLFFFTIRLYSLVRNIVYSGNDGTSFILAGVYVAV